MNMYIHAITLKNNSNNFIAKAKKIFNIPQISIKEIRSQTYWKDEDSDEFDLYICIADGFSLTVSEWENLIKQFSNVKIVTEIFDDFLDIGMYCSYYDMLADPSLYFIWCRIPTKHCELNND